MHPTPRDTGLTALSCAPTSSNAVESLMQNMFGPYRGLARLADGASYVGFEQVVFYGHEIDKDGHRQTERNLDPIRKCVAPETVSELRSVLGMFVQRKNRIKDFAIIARPLHN